MQRTIISDTSCLILFDNINELFLLNKLFGAIIITEVVFKEFGKTIPDFIKIENPKLSSVQLIQHLHLDEGEKSAIALALENKNSLLIIDEIKGRKFAKELGISITGSIGIIIEAKKLGLINSVLPILSKIKQSNFRISEQLILDALKQANEI